MQAAISKHLNKIQTFLKVTRHCVLCSAKSDTEFDLCAACCQEIQSESSVCRCCASPISTTVSTRDKDGKLCGSCVQNLPPYTSVYRFADYVPPLDRIIQDLKFNQKLHYAQLLGHLMAKDIRAREIELPDILMPVPLHSRRLKQRGFNQALEIGRPLGKYLGLPVDIHSCIRSRPTPEQSGLPAKQRKTNIKGAFQVRNKIQGKHIAILDDVMTTGSTVNELTQVLKSHGATRVDVWVCARANL